MCKKLTATSKKYLVELRTRLLEGSEHTATDRKPVELDQTSVGRLSRMDALQIQAMQVETERRRHIELQRIESALKRIKDGEYGYCVICGEDIGVKRIKNDPAVPACITCSRNSI